MPRKTKEDHPVSWTDKIFADAEDSDLTVSDDFDATLPAKPLKRELADIETQSLRRRIRQLELTNKQLQKELCLAQAKILSFEIEAMSEVEHD